MDYIQIPTFMKRTRPDICILERPSIWPQKPVIQTCHRRDFRLEIWHFSIVARHFNIYILPFSPSYILFGTTVRKYISFSDSFTRRLLCTFRQSLGWKVGSQKCKVWFGSLFANMIRMSREELLLGFTVGL